MPLMPKRVKHRKSQRGRIKGEATRGNRVIFGEFDSKPNSRVGFLLPRSRPAELLPSNTCGAVGDCIYACFHTSQLPLSHWKPVWVKVKVNLISGLQ